MLRDDSTDPRRKPISALNVFGEPLEICSFKPTTGFYRDGCCNTGQEDVGSHTVCVVMTAEFLEFSRSRGNDFIDRASTILGSATPTLPPKCKEAFHQFHESQYGCFLEARGLHRHATRSNISLSKIACCYGDGGSSRRVRTEITSG